MKDCFERRYGGDMDKNKIANAISKISELSDEQQKYLYGQCDRWVKENFKDGLEIVAIMESAKHENGIVHCYIRNPDNGCYYDVRGEMNSDEDVLAYTGIDYNEDNIEEFVFESLNDFEIYLKWVDFEMVKDNFRL